MTPKRVIIEANPGLLLIEGSAKTVLIGCMAISDQGVTTSIKIPIKAPIIVDNLLPFYSLYLDGARLKEEIFRLGC